MRRKHIPIISSYSLHNNTLFLGEQFILHRRSDPLYLDISYIPQLIPVFLHQHLLLLHLHYHLLQQDRNQLLQHPDVIPQVGLHAGVHPPQHPEPKGPEPRALRQWYQELQVHFHQHLHGHLQRPLHAPHLPLRVLPPRVLQHLLVQVIHHRENDEVEAREAVRRREVQLLRRRKAFPQLRHRLVPDLLAPDQARLPQRLHELHEQICSEVAGATTGLLAVLR